MGNHKKKKKKNKRGKKNKSTAEPREAGNSPDSECESDTSFQGETTVPGDGEPPLTEFQSKLGSEGQQANNEKFNDEFEIGQTNDFPLQQMKASENNKAEDEGAFTKRPRFSDKDSGTPTKPSVHELDKESLADTAEFHTEFPEEANSSQPSKKRKKKKRKKQAEDGTGVVNSQEPGQAFAKPTSQPETPVGACATPQKESHIETREEHRSDSVTTAIPTNTGQLLTTNEDG